MGDPNQQDPQQEKPNRYEVERNERKGLNELQRFIENDGRSGKPRPTSSRRGEELRDRVSQMHLPKNQQQPAASPPAMTNLEFYCWKDGKAGTIRLAVAGSFVEFSE